MKIGTDEQNLSGSQPTYTVYRVIDGLLDERSIIICDDIDEALEHIREGIEHSPHVHVSMNKRIVIGISRKQDYFIVPSYIFSKDSQT